MPTTFTPATIETLAANLGALSPKDASFAADLIAAWKQCQKKGWDYSPGRAKWAAILAERATGPKPEPKAATEIGSMASITSMFDTAAKALKRPAVVLTGEGMDFSIRLSVAGAQSKAPGSLNVTTLGSFDDREWLGRIASGAFTPAMKIGEREAAVTALLKAFAADPKGTAAHHGKLTGACCFCNRKLTHKVSVAVGYGPDCAENYGLPHEAPAALAA